MSASAACDQPDMSVDPDSDHEWTPVVLPEFLLKQLQDLHGRIEFCTGQQFTLAMVSHSKEVRNVVIGRPKDRPPVDPKDMRPKILVPEPPHKKRRT